MQTSFLAVFCWILCVACAPECPLPAESVTKRVTVESKFDPARSMASPHYDALGILVKRADGTLLSVYREGLTHDADKGQIIMRESEDGMTWSAPRILFQDPILDDRNVAGGILPSGTIVVFWNSWDFTKRRSVALFFSRSSDNGETWTPPTQIPGRNNAYGPVIVFPDSVAISVGNEAKTYLHFSFDDGATWNFSRPVPAPNYEVSFISLDGGRILGFARNDSQRPILRLFSEDGGATWDVAETGLRASSPASPWELVSPWVVQVPASPAQLDLWYAERLDSGKPTERGALRSILFDEDIAVSNPGCLIATKALFATGSRDFGYPSVVLLPPNKFLGQFYSSGQDDLANLLLISGEYVPKEPESQ